jgi:PAS domain S-box-containing protein
MPQRNDAVVDPRLLESEERYRAVIDNASDMIQSIRPDGTFEFVNPAWLRTLGYTEDEVAGLTIWDVIHPSSLEHCQVAFASVMRGSAAKDLRVTFATKDGSPVEAEGSAQVRAVDGEVIATHAFFRDITERLRAQELERRNAQLEREKIARYLEKMAALGKLSAGLAHELNNPAAAAQRASAQLLDSLADVDVAVQALTASQLVADQPLPFEATSDGIARRLSAEPRPTPLEISRREAALEGWLDTHSVDESWKLASTLAEAGITTDDLEHLTAALPPSALEPVVHCMCGTLVARDLAESIATSTRRISELVNAVKSYSYMDRSLEQVVDIHDGLEDTLVILAHWLARCTVQRDYDRGLPPVRTVGSGLNQVWTNILDNAVDATGGHGAITIRTRRQDNRVVVEIEDDGPGIPDEVRTRVFEPFFTTKPQGQGLGLGLDTVWRIVTEQHGGTVELESRPGQTTFRVSIPFER